MLRLLSFRSLRVLLALLTVIAGGTLVLPVSARQTDGADLQMNQLAISQSLRGRGGRSQPHGGARGWLRPDRESDGAPPLDPDADRLTQQVVHQPGGDA